MNKLKIVRTRQQMQLKLNVFLKYKMQVNNLVSNINLNNSVMILNKEQNMKISLQEEL